MFCFLRFPSGLAAHLHLSWLDPHKERRFTVVGSRRMATFDDMALEGKLTIYDKGFDEDTHGYGEYITRSGEIFSPSDLRTPSRCGSSASTSSTAFATGQRRARTAPAGCASCACSSSSSGHSMPPRRRCESVAELIAATAVIHEAARIGAGTEIGDASVIHAGTELGDALRTIEDWGGARQASAPAPRIERGAATSARSSSTTASPSARCRRCTRARRSATNAIIGDQSQVRERARIGERTVVGRASFVDFNVESGRGS